MGRGGEETGGRAEGGNLTLRSGQKGDKACRGAGARVKTIDNAHHIHILHHHPPPPPPMQCQSQTGRRGPYCARRAPTLPVPRHRTAMDEHPVAEVSIRPCNALAGVTSAAAWHTSIASTQCAAQVASSSGT